MLPLHFGSPERRLYGVYHPAVIAPGPSRAIVICSPWGPEYSLSHRAIRQVATALAAQGNHVLRFDYFGTGDSDGRSEEGCLAGWATDVQCAIDELGDITGTSRVSLIGLRLGACLASCVASRRPQLIEKIIVWDPIVRPDYLEELSEAGMRTYGLPSMPHSDGSGSCEVCGFLLNADLSSCFSAFNPARPFAALSLPIELVVSGQESDLALAKHAIGSALIRNAISVAERPCWSDDGSLATGFVPTRVIRTLVELTA